MKKAVFAALGLLALTGCSAAPDTYDFSVADAQERLINGTYAKGSIQNFSSHNITRARWAKVGSSGRSGWTMAAPAFAANRS